MIRKPFFSSVIPIGIALLVLTGFSSCDKSDSESYLITVGAFSLDSIGNYIFTGQELIFASVGECQTWSRTAVGDSHSAGSHLHYNAASNVSYDNGTTTFSWTEYGPELNQESIEATCDAGNNGANKTVNNSSYYQDKPNVFLKITNVIEN
jgi:hypothetical protein